MRTYEDVKEALKSFEDELKRESGIKRDHYIIMGGSVNVVKKGVGEYALDKGTPVPMIWETAKKKQAEFQEKCGDNIRLEIIKYSDWLIKNIDECKKLMECMRQQFSSGEDSQKKVDPEPEPESAPESPSSADVNSGVSSHFATPATLTRPVEMASFSISSSESARFHSRTSDISPQKRHLAASGP